jgi:hypothetical protein
MQLKILSILRDEQVHRDVLQVLCARLSGRAFRRHHGEPTATTVGCARISTYAMASSADLNQVCRAILAFHYGAVLPAGAGREQILNTAAAYWRWQAANPWRESYLVDHQRRDPFGPGGDIVLLGTAGFEHVVKGMRSVVLQRLDRHLLPQLTSRNGSVRWRRTRVQPHRSKREVGMRRTASVATAARLVHRGRR